MLSSAQWSPAEGRRGRQLHGKPDGGNPASAYDKARAAGRDDAIVIPLVLVVILVIIALLQAIVAPVVLVATTALSLAASLGLSSLLWHGLG